MICEPLELMQLAAVLRANHHEVQIVDMILEKKALEHFIHEFEPQLVGITGYISHIGIMKEYARRIKKIDQNILVAVGGVHATVCPEDFSCESIDCVARSADDLYKLAKCQDTRVRYADRSLPSHYTDKYYYLFADKCALIKHPLAVLTIEISASAKRSHLTKRERLMMSSLSCCKFRKRKFTLLMMISSSIATDCWSSPPSCRKTKSRRIFWYMAERIL
jgi:hypothetical protein